MRAAVVTRWDRPPSYQEFPTPEPRTADEELVKVVAAGLHPRVRSQADGSHYTSRDDLPLIPGIDGVGRCADGTLCYFILPDTTLGAMAEQTLIDRRRSIPLPPDCDPIRIAAGMNPAMASWVALRKRIDFEPGQRVLVLGATGSAGQMAIQVAKFLGASHVIGAGRQAQALALLADLGADATVQLGSETDDVGPTLGAAAADVDVVIDFIWGQATAEAMLDVVMQRTDRSKALAWIEIGSVAGPTAEIPSAALRAARLQIVGSGQGSVPARDFVSELPELARLLTRGTFSVAARTIPLRDVERAWNDRNSAQRLVITP